MRWSMREASRWGPWALACVPLVLSAACASAEKSAARAPMPESPPPVAEAAPSAAREKSPKPALDEEARVTLDIIRASVHENDLDGARELLSEAVAALVDPELGGEKAHIAFLLELDGLAKQLGSLAVSKCLRESVLRLRVGILPRDHPDVLAAKQGLAATLYELGDLAGAHVLFEEVLAARTRLLPADHPDLLAAKQNLAATRKELGDLVGARELLEEVLSPD